MKRNDPRWVLLGELAARRAAVADAIARYDAALLAAQDGGCTLRAMANAQGLRSHVAVKMRIDRIRRGRQPRHQVP